MLKFYKMAENRFFPLNWPKMAKKRQKNRKNAFFGDFSIFQFLLTRSVRNGFQKFNVFLTETSTSLNCHNFPYIEARDLIFF